MKTENYHIPVMLKEAIECLDINPDGIYIDATFGGGGHSKQILKRLDKGKLIAFDADPDALSNAFKKDNFILIHSNFAYIPYYLKFLQINKVDGILADLGVSSYQIDTPERGFSYRFDADLDMRMNKNAKITAKYILNNYSFAELISIFTKYGEIYNANKLAKTIIGKRKRKPINTTGDFLNAIKNLIPQKNREKFLSQVFQAIRIEVNNEIENLKIFLKNIPKILKINGIAIIISYHSLEDRLVKNFFKTSNFQGKRITDLYGNQLNYFNVLTKKPLTPSEKEIEKNPRSRSAKLRCAKLVRTDLNFE